MPDPTSVALVTGGARRVGKAIVEDLAAHGWAVAIHHNHSSEDAAKVADGIRARGGKVAIVRGDLSDPTCHTEMIVDAAKALGPVTLLVNNASIFEKDTAGALDRALFDRQIAVNLAAPVFLAEAFAKALPDGAEGNIINLLDQRVLRPTPAYFSYQLAKSALLTATITMAEALAPRIRVNGIAPGPVLPAPKATQEQFDQLVETSTLLKRPPDRSEFGRTIRYIVETRSITGQVIALDSGQHLKQ